jgi:hypothetical protein
MGKASKVPTRIQAWDRAGFVLGPFETLGLKSVRQTSVDLDASIFRSEDMAAH